MDVNLLKLILHSGFFFPGLFASYLTAQEMTDHLICCLSVCNEQRKDTGKFKADRYVEKLLGWYFIGMFYEGKKSIMERNVGGCVYWREKALTR